MTKVQMPANRRAVSLRFGEFELRLDSLELFRSGIAVKLQPQPAKVLAILAGQAGEMVRREEIRRAVWGDGTYVDFDLALNFTILQIRRALGDSAAHPRFVATLPRRGYRFLAPVEVVSSAAAPPASAETAVPRQPPAQRRSAPSAAGALPFLPVALLLIAFGLMQLQLRHLSPPTAAPARVSPGYQRYLEGQYLAAQGESELAMGRFQEAAILDPRSPAVFASIGQELLGTGRPAREVVATAEREERRALALDPNDLVAAVDRGQRLFQYAYDWRRAEAEFRRAVRLDGRSAQGHFGLAKVLSAQGRHDEALAEVNRAQALEPERMPAMNLGWFYYLARRHDEAIAQARRTIALAGAAQRATAARMPISKRAHWTLMLAELAKGDGQAVLAAAREQARAMAVPPPASLTDFWAQAERAADRSNPAGLEVAVVAAIELGHADHALDLLHRQCEERSGFEIPFLRVNPVYDPLRRLPRFAALLRCAKLEE